VRALADAERKLGLTHPDTLQIRSALAASYRLAGRLAESVDLQRRVVMDAEQHLGAEHPLTLKAAGSTAQRGLRWAR
jgi:hypothetical protein